MFQARISYSNILGLLKSFNYINFNNLLINFILMPNFYETIKPHLDEIENRVILLGEVSQVTKSEKKNTKLVEFKAEVSFHCLTITKELGNIKKALFETLQKTKQDGEELKKSEEN